MGAVLSARTSEAYWDLIEAIVELRLRAEYRPPLRT